MKFVRRKTYPFLALQASIRDLKLDQHRDVLENLMAEVIEHKIKEIM